jgi:S-adenosylmethionine uptake transporter
VGVAVAMGLSWLVVLVAIDESLKRAPLARVAPFLYTALIWSTLIGWLAFGDPVTRRSLAGALLVLAGCAIGIVPWRRERGDLG